MAPLPNNPLPPGADMTQTHDIHPVEQPLAPASEPVVIPEQHKALVDEILAYTKTAFNVPFTFEVQVGEGDSVWLVGPLGTFAIGLGAPGQTNSESEPQLMNLISVSLEGDPQFLCVTSHAYANKFGLTYMEPHVMGVGPKEGALVFGQEAYHTKQLVDEAKVRHRIIEIAGEAARTAAFDEVVTGGKPALVDANGQALH